MQFELTPPELQAIPHWVNWGKNKVPIDPKTGRAASSTDPSTWAPFAVAVQAAEKYNGIGFVLSESDPYTFIDLDAGGDAAVMKFQREIFEYFDSYTEFSPSGKGLHIIVRADCPYARRSNHVEVYGTARYMTMTGNIYHNRGIEERQLHVEQLLATLGGPKAGTVSLEGSQVSEDNELWERMVQAQNGDAIRALANGEWQPKYGSQSEADMALINHLVWYTQCQEQVTRMFRQSGLGQRPKAQRDDYVRRMISIATDQLVPANAIINIDVNAIRASLVDTARPTQAVAPKLENCFPDGLVGQIASYIYKSYPRPVPEIALAGAIGLMSGICGRSYNVSGTGLNMYTLLLAKTGTGKDAMAQGISRIRQQISETVPAASDFVGPNMASGQALARHLAEKSPAFVSIFGEFGKQLERYSSKGASSADRALATLLLDLYSKSGAGVYMPGTVFADTAKNTADLLSPSFSILGESTPETYYAVADEAAIAEGLLPRFLVIEYEGPRVPKRDVAAADYLLHPVVRQQLADLCDGSLRMMARHEAIDVLLTPEAQVFLDEFDRQADNRINSSQQSVTRQLWNRAHLKALKLAALLAVGCHPFTPVITLEQAQWAQQIVEADVLRVISRFDSGNLGFDNSLANDSERRAAAVVKVLRGYPGFDVAAASNLNIKPGMIDDLVIPHSTLRRNVCATAAFRKIPGYKTPSHLFKEVIDQLIEDEVLAKVPASVLWMKYQHTGTAYQILG